MTYLFSLLGRCSCCCWAYVDSFDTLLFDLRWCLRSLFVPTPLPRYYDYCPVDDSEFPGVTAPLRDLRYGDSYRFVTDLRSVRTTVDDLPVYSRYVVRSVDFVCYACHRLIYLPIRLFVASVPTDIQLRCCRICCIYVYRRF